MSLLAQMPVCSMLHLTMASEVQQSYTSSTFHNFTLKQTTVCFWQSFLKGWLTRQSVSHDFLEFRPIDSTDSNLLSSDLQSTMAAHSTQPSDLLKLQPCVGKAIHLTQCLEWHSLTCKASPNNIILQVAADNFLFYEFIDHLVSYVGCPSSPPSLSILQTDHASGSKYRRLLRNSHIHYLLAKGHWLILPLNRDH